MKRLSLKYIFLQLLFAGLMFSNYNASAQKTTIWLVRHAEKADTPATNPPLTLMGQQRARALMQNIKGNKISAIYVSNYLRTSQTAKPIADKFSLTPQVYDTADLKTMAAKILQSYKGKNVLIVGHSNTIVPTITAFGGEAPFTALNEDDYDMVFKLTVKNGKADLDISYYGTPHHSTQIPEKYDRNLNPMVQPIRNF